MNEVTSQFKVFNLYTACPDDRQEIVKIMNSFAKQLMNEGKLVDFYNTVYFFPPEKPYVRFGFLNLRDENMVNDKFTELQDKGKITNWVKTKSDREKVDGVVMDRVKIVSRRISELIQTEFKNPLTVKQANYLIHLAMNNFFGYIDERELYLSLTISMEKALRANQSIPKKEWLRVLDEYLAEK
jgi:hypothetical protein